MRKTVLPALQERSRKTKALLLKSAIEVLENEGLDGASIPRIAARAGVTPGAIYRRFPDKDSLLREVCLRVHEQNYQHSHELLKPERWKGKSLAEICTFVIETTLRGHSRHRRLLRALLTLTISHSDPAFVRKSEEYQWKVFRDASDLLLTRRSEMRHSDPTSAVPFALLMVGMAARGVLVLPRNAKHISRLVPQAEDQLQRELPRMVMRYLGVDCG